MALFRHLGVFLLCFSLSSSEPACSRFHYEEQTLKKMIMVELLVDKLKAEVEGTAKAVNDALTEWKTDRDVTKQELKQLQTSIKLNMEKNVQEIKEMKDSVGTKEVLFRARGIKNLSPVRGETWVFETTVTNKGSGYDNTTGIFTVPVSGTFMFSVQFYLNNNKYIYFEIIADDLAILKGLKIDDYGSPAGCYTSVVPAYLKAGQHVWVKTGRTGSGTLWERASEAWNMFSGVLIQT